MQLHIQARLHHQGYVRYGRSAGIQCTSIA